MSKIYENRTNHNPEVYSPKKIKAKKTSPVRIEIINQDLEEAIIDVRNAIKSQSWRKDLNRVADKYKQDKESNVSEKMKDSSAKKFEPILCTEAYRRRYEQQLKETKAKREQIQIRSI